MKKRMISLILVASMCAGLWPDAEIPESQMQEQTLQRKEK